MLRFSIIFILNIVCASFMWANDTFLFQAEKEGDKIKIFGTLHDLPLQALPPAIMDYIQNHEVLITENTQALEPLTLNICEKMGLLRNSEEPNYYDCLIEAEKEELEAYAIPFLKHKQATNLGLDQLNTNGLYQAYLMGHFVTGMDYALLHHYKNHKLILGLEDLQEISQSFEQLTIHDLKCELYNHAGFGSEEHKRSENLYLSGDIPALEENDLMVQRRNLDWLPTLLNYHRQYGEKAIVCVGYQHLFGEFGILRLLEEAGYKIMRANQAIEFSDFSSFL
ncbi:TraB/GumN family protein [Candidatus Odyssella acanthamoebae]|uniref:Polysaccharide biosynthesis protein GumN n=1 Tax=Candidatus Odyssella acanthamoebae TaxID=91604 RepID=A0A077AUX6_9PROT|nr:TraB/GumN family protein [Candidatus Paracaedibacter acanthamoebae]AIK95839.1 hypothetical protein ID47_02450 [Candidatus Paracaedibacter acanthamoebae]